MSHDAVINYVVAKEAEANQLRAELDLYKRERQAQLKAYSDIAAYMASPSTASSVVPNLRQSSEFTTSLLLRQSLDAPSYQPRDVQSSDSEDDDCCKSTDILKQPKEEVKPIKTVASDTTIRPPEHWSCSICLDDDPVDGRCAQLQCGHTFCQLCIVEWISTGKTDCPNCRARIESVLC